MELILREDVENLGRKGDKVEVAPGYARNYLLPRRLALEVNPNNLRLIEKEKKHLLVKLVKEKEEAEEMARRLGPVRLAFRRKVHGEELYGSVSSADIADALAAKGYAVEKRKILLEESIKTLGEFTVTAKVHPEVVASFTVVVGKEEA